MNLAAFCLIAALGVPAALAASAAGTVTAVNETAHTVTLSDDMTYTTTPTMDLSRIKVGYTIRISFTAEAGTNKITVLEILSPVQPSGY